MTTGYKLNRRDYLGGSLALAASAVAMGAAHAQSQAPAAAEPVKEPPLIAPPDPNTKVPTFKAPPGSIDTHTHIFGPQSVYPFAATRPYTAPDAGLPAFATLHGKIGVERAVIVNATVHGFDNRVVTDAIALSGGRYKGIANVSDTISDRELEALEQAGIRGCRYAFLARLGGKPDFSRVKRMADRIKGLKWCIDLYLEPALYDDFFPQMRTLAVPYVIDHMGTIKAADGGVDQPAFKKLLDLQRTDEKCWVKISGPERMSSGAAPFQDAVPFAKKLIETAPDRVIWGSDWPHPNVRLMPNDGDLIDFVPRCATTAALQRKLLVENPAKLFRF